MPHPVLIGLTLKRCIGPSLPRCNDLRWKSMWVSETLNAVIFGIFNGLIVAFLPVNSEEILNVFTLTDGNCSRMGRVDLRGLNAFASCQGWLIALPPRRPLLSPAAYRLTRRYLSTLV